MSVYPFTDDDGAGRRVLGVQQCLGVDRVATRRRSDRRSRRGGREPDLRAGPELVRRRAPVQAGAREAVADARAATPRCSRRPPAARSARSRRSSRAARTARLRMYRAAADAAATLDARRARAAGDDRDGQRHLLPPLSGGGEPGPSPGPAPVRSGRSPGIAAIVPRSTSSDSQSWPEEVARIIEMSTTMNPRGGSCPATGADEA